MKTKAMRIGLMKVLTALMAVPMMIGLAGCGDTTVNNEPPSIENIYSDWREEMTESSTTETSENIYSTEGSEEMAETVEDDSRAEAKPTIDAGAAAITEDDGISGLIIMDANMYLEAGVCEVYSFDPESGNNSSISKFWFKNEPSIVAYLWGYAPAIGYYQFDNTYTRMATRKFLSGTGDEHAGWLSNDGSYFDVIEAIGWNRQGDFDDPVHFNSVGFTDNDLFVFRKIGGDGSYEAYYSVPIYDVSAGTVQECNCIAYSAYSIKDYKSFHSDIIWKYGEPTGWIDTEHCILTQKSTWDNSETSVIFDLTNKTSTDYIPGDSRNNWDGRVSPDKTQIAFVSAPKSGNESPDIFIVSVDGGEPIRVPEHDFTLSGVRLQFGSYNSESVILIDWR